LYISFSILSFKVENLPHCNVNLFIQSNVRLYYCTRMESSPFNVTL